MSNSTTTPSPYLPSGEKDILLIVASVSMALATVALILVVRMLERCLPDADREETARQQEKKALKMRELIEKSTVLLTYGEWLTKTKGPSSLALPGTTRPTSKSSVRETVTLPNATSSPERISEPTIQIESAGGQSETGGATVLGRARSEQWCDDCAVCLTDFSSDEKIRELPCAHIYHEECVYSWFLKSKRPVCPLCRFNLQHSRVDDEPALSPRVNSEGVVYSSANPPSQPSHQPIASTEVV